MSTPSAYQSAFAFAAIRAGTLGSGGIVGLTLLIEQQHHLAGVALGFAVCVTSWILHPRRPALAEKLFLGGCAVSVWLAGAKHPTAEGVGSAALSWILLGIFGSLLLTRTSLAWFGLVCCVGVASLAAWGTQFGLPLMSPGNIVALIFVATGFAVLGEIAEHFRSSMHELELAEREAREALETKSRFLANMSHELRTPLNAIIGYSELLAEEDEDGTNTVELQRIQDAGRGLLDHIDALLDLSKIDAAHTQVFLEEVDLAEVIATITELMRPLFARSGNRVVVEAGPNLTVQTDLTKMRKVLTNLLSNANKFTKNGTITLNARIDEQLVVSVADTGIGIASDSLEKLFDAFVQADASTTREYGGTGLGLTLVRDYCSLLGGSVTVESELGVGSTFTVTLPVAPA